MLKIFKRKKKQDPSADQAGSPQAGSPQANTESDGKKEEKKLVPQKMVEGIHTMPKQFYLDKEKGTGSKKKVVVVVILVIGLAVMITSSVLIYNSMKADVEAGEDNQVVQKVADPEPEPEPEQEPEPEAEIPNQVRDDIEVEIEPPEPQVPQIIVTGAQDLDEDSLTLNEEKIYSTDPGKADTDNDSYSDGEEIANLFSPTLEGQRLLESRLVEVYTDTQYGFQVYYPARWLQSVNDTGEKREIIFNSKVGELITLTVSQGETFAQESGEFTEIIRSDDSNEVFIFTYEPLFPQYRNFTTTFKMMVNSFQLQ